MCVCVCVCVCVYNSMDIYLRLLFSCRLYTTILRQRMKDFGEIEKIEKSPLKYVYVRVAYNSLRAHARVCVCVFDMHLMTDLRLS